MTFTFLNFLKVLSAAGVRYPGHYGGALHSVCARSPKPITSEADLSYCLYDMDWLARSRQTQLAKILWRRYVDALKQIEPLR
jgi:hypothetical protein